MRMPSVLLAAFLCCLPVVLLAAPCQVKAPDFVTHVDTAWSAEPIPGVKVTPLVTKEFNGISGSSWAFVRLGPGAVNPPHRHSGSEEFVFVTKGEAIFNIWAPGKAGKETVVLKEGSFHYLPAEGIHDVHTEKGVEFVVSTTPGGFRWEVLEAWPEPLDAPVKGQMVEVLGPVGCPPGQEAHEEL